MSSTAAGSGSATPCGAGVRTGRLARQRVRERPGAPRRRRQCHMELLRPGRDPHLRSPHRSVAVVLGAQRERPTRRRHDHCALDAITLGFRELEVGDRLEHRRHHLGWSHLRDQGGRQPVVLGRQRLGSARRRHDQWPTQPGAGRQRDMALGVGRRCTHVRHPQRSDVVVLGLQRDRTPRRRDDDLADLAGEDRHRALEVGVGRAGAHVRRAQRQLAVVLGFEQLRPGRRRRPRLAGSPPWRSAPPPGRT